MDTLTLSGQSDKHVISFKQGDHRLMPEVASAFKSMQESARQQGIEIAPVSTFRSFEHQLSIWNQKFTGERQLLDINGSKIDLAVLTDEEKVDRILYWSALPGASRHHWGTDIDIIDLTGLEKGKSFDLVPNEYIPGGPFFSMHQWLKKHAQEFGFFFPYQGLNQMMYNEPWHISFHSLADVFLQEINLELIRTIITASHINGKDTIINQLPDIITNKVYNIALY